MLFRSGHNGVPTPYTAFVPVYTSPASLAEGWREDGLAGTDGAPWSLVNVGYGLVDDVGVARPASWPGPEPVGRATSWICKGPDGGGQSGVRIEGTEAVRCRHGTCDAVSFVIPTDETATAAPLETVPDSLAGWMGSPDWFTTACAGG